LQQQPCYDRSPVACHPTANILVKRRRRGAEIDMTGAFGLVVRFIVTAGHESAFDELAAETVREIATNEPGTLVYACHRVEGAPRQRTFYELYRDRTAFEVHESQPHVRRFLTERTPLLDDVVVERLDLTAAAGIGTS